METIFQNLFQTMYKPAVFLPSPAPPVTVFKFEKIWEPIKTNAILTKAKFNPFNLTANWCNN